jgi:hypothetical protein
MTLKKNAVWPGCSPANAAKSVVRNHAVARMITLAGLVIQINLPRSLSDTAIV